MDWKLSRKNYTFSYETDDYWWFTLNLFATFHHIDIRKIKLVIFMNLTKLIKSVFLPCVESWLACVQLKLFNGMHWGAGPIKMYSPTMKGSRSARFIHSAECILMTMTLQDSASCSSVTMLTYLTNIFSTKGGCNYQPEIKFNLFNFVLKYWRFLRVQMYSHLWRSWFYFIVYQMSSYNVCAL